MYIHSVKLVNYKSIGDYNEAEVILEPTITASNAVGNGNFELNDKAKSNFRVLFERISTYTN